MSTNFTKFLYTPRQPPPRRHTHRSTAGGSASRDSPETAERRRLRVNYVQLRRKRRLTILKKADEYHKLLDGHISVVMYEDGKFFGYTSKPGNPKWPPSFRHIDMTFPLPEIYTPESNKPWRDLVADPEHNTAGTDDNIRGKLGDELRDAGAVGEGDTSRPAHTTAPLPTSAALQEALLGFQLQSVGGRPAYRPILPVPRKPLALPCTVTNVNPGGHHDEDDDALSTSDGSSSNDDGTASNGYGEQSSGSEGSTDESSHIDGSGDDGDDETSSNDDIHATWGMASGLDHSVDDSIRGRRYSRPITYTPPLSLASPVAPHSDLSIPRNVDPGLPGSPGSRGLYDERRLALAVGPHLAPARASNHRQTAHRVVKRHRQRWAK